MSDVKSTVYLLIRAPAVQKGGMAPALTKVMKDGHGIHLSSPLSSVRMDSNGRPVHNPHMRFTQDGEPQKIWLHLSLFPSLDSCLSVSPLDSLGNPGFSPRLQTFSSERQTVLLPSPASFLSPVSFNNSQRDSHQVVSVLPGVPDMFLGIVPEHNSQEACLLRGSSDASECVPAGGDMNHCLSVSPSCSTGEVKSHSYTPLVAPPPTITQEKVAEMGSLHPASVQRCSGRLNFNQLASRAVHQQTLKEQLSRQAELHGRTWRLHRRLQALLGEHILLHCNQQLEGLKRHCQVGDVSQDVLDSIYPGIVRPEAGSKHQFSWLESSTVSSSLTELREFSCSSQAVLRSVQEALDSEATASSSSDEESVEDNNHVKARMSSVSSCNRQWLEERAELGSRWSWLQLRLAKLEGRIQHLVELHKHIRSSKGRVVLAETQPLTDRQIQQNLLREMGGLSPTATDDTEHCSPMRLLHNIERQSAQLSQIVTSLMPPLSFSPLSKQTQEKLFFLSGHNGDNGFVPGSSKRRRLGSRKPSKADMSCICARTRPLVTYHKPRLFTFSSPQDLGQTSTLTSSLSSSSCSCCSSCDPVVLCSDPDCSSSWALSSRNPSSRPHPVLSPLFDTPPFQHLQRLPAREQWFQKPLVINAELPTPAHYNRCSSTPLHNSHKYKPHARHHKSKVLGLSPIRRSGSARCQHRKANQRKRKRRCIRLLMEDEVDDLYQLCDIHECSDKILEEIYTQVSRKQVCQGFSRQRQGESVYNIDNIVIPMSLGKVEKLQYKNILTPSWRVVDTHSVTGTEEGKEEDSEEGQVEDLTDEVFAQRHLAMEQREKLRWSSWGKRKCCRRPARPGSRLSGSGGVMCTSGEESSMEWCGAQLETDEQPSSEEWLPQTPWEPRVFPLNEEDPMLFDHFGKIPLEWSESSSVPSTSKSSNSHFPVTQSSGAKLPSAGLSWNITYSSS